MHKVVLKGLSLWDSDCMVSIKKIITVFYQAVLESLIRYRIQAWYGKLSVQLKNRPSYIVWMAMKIVALTDYPPPLQHNFDFSTFRSQGPEFLATALAFGKSA